jgi:hypothetical protein
MYLDEMECLLNKERNEHISLEECQSVNYIGREKKFNASRVPGYRTEMYCVSCE